MLADNISESAIADSSSMVSPMVEREIIALIHKAARLSDDRKYMQWIDLFTDDADYSAITYENFTTTGLYLFKDTGKRSLHERAAFQLGMWQTPRGKTLHLVTNIVIEPGESETSATAASNFIMTRTGDMEHSQLHACGQYLDRFERQSGSWLFKSRKVIVDSNVLPPEFTELL